MGDSPSEMLKKSSFQSFQKKFAGFRHRFAKGDHLSAMLTGSKAIIREHGSLYKCFLKGFKKDDETVLPALSFFTGEIVKHGDPGHLIPLPDRGSACKRMNLFLRWMIRKDDVDPGGWDDIPASKLIVPLDVHMHRICLRAGLTKRKQANMKTAIEITDGFKTFAPEDPVRYDFALTRLGIRDDTDLEEFF